MPTTLACNLRIKSILRDALAFGTLEQCVEASMVCHEVEVQGYNISQTEKRLWSKLTEKIERLKNAANQDQGDWHVIYR